MRLTVETGPQAGTVVPLDRDHPALLGSGEDCALRISQTGVLEHHAVVKALRGEGFGLKALGPGVRVNGEQIEATPLADGDRIEIGATRIAFGETQQKGLPSINGYRIQEELGRGGMGTVYHAEQVSLSRAVALKVLSHELTENVKFVSNFIAEAQAAAKLQHPNVVSVFDVEHEGDLYYYAMELMQNGSCEDWLKQNGAMPVDRALRVIADAAEGLAYAESLGIVHRDIKPDNLMLDQHGVIKIADLGLAGAEADERAVGTPHFMAPEQVLRQNIDHRTDLYALGCTFHRLVTGRTPFRGQTVKDILRAQVKDDAEPAHKINSAVPTEVSNIIQRLMAKDPADRYQTANALLEDLGVLLQPPAKKGMWIALAAVAVLLAGGATWWAINKRGETVKVTEYLDNPEAARLAKENEQLKREQIEDRATIALLMTRTSGLTDETMAQAFDKIVQEHPDTKAAVEARQRAQAVRTEVRARQVREQQRTQQIETFLITLLQSIEPYLEAHDYALALRALQTEPPAEIRGADGVRAGTARLREQIVAHARARLVALSAAVDTARQGEDPEALGPVIDTLAENVAAVGRWPEELKPELELGDAKVKDGRAALAQMMRQVRDDLWQDFRALFAGEDGFAACISRLDFTAAATAAETFAAQAPGEEPGTRAGGLALAARGAEKFAAALEQRLAAGDLELTDVDGKTWTIASWQRSTGNLQVLDPRKRAPKEQSLAVATLTPMQWSTLSAAVADSETGLRECFLAFVLLDRHAAAARDYLAGFDRNSDESGIGDRGYPLASDWFDQVQSGLPNDPALPWAASMRREIDAGKRLAAGLRALSERRNLAAAGHLDKLLGDHAHSYLVMVLP